MRAVTAPLYLCLQYAFTCLFSSFLLKNRRDHNLNILKSILGARGETRTHTLLPEMDFESIASANSTTRARLQHRLIGACKNIAHHRLLAKVIFCLLYVQVCIQAIYQHLCLVLLQKRIVFKFFIHPRWVTVPRENMRIGVKLANDAL